MGSNPVSFTKFQTIYPQMDLGLILFTIGTVLFTIFEFLYVIHINVKDIGKEEKK